MDEDKKDAKSTRNLVMVIIIVIVSLVVLSYVVKVVTSMFTKVQLEAYIEEQTGIEFEVPKQDSLQTNMVEEVNEDFALPVAPDEEDLEEVLLKDVPIYKNANKVKSTVFPNVGGKVTFTTEDSEEDVINFYAEKLISEGWKKESEFKLKEKLHVAYLRDNAEKVSITVYTEEGVVTFEVSHMKPE